MQRRYLIIATDVHATAPGVVFNTLIQELASYCDSIVILSCIDINDTFPKNVEIVHGPQYIPYIWTAAKKRWRQFGFSPKDAKWWRLTYCNVIGQLKGKTFDVVLSFTSMGNFPPIQLGKKLSKKFSAKWAIYSVDGIPSPIGWIDDEKVHNIISKFLDKICRHSDIFLSSNFYMMKYEETILKHFQGQWGYIYTPIASTKPILEKSHGIGTVFLYAGNIYGLRKIDGLISGFRRYLQHCPSSKLVFVGDVPQKFFISDMDLLDSGNIELHPFTHNITEYYERADVLIDIAADIPNDIFLSSKIISYLPVCRPIMAISGDNSPVRNIFSDTDSIRHCYNDPESVENCMRSIINCDNFEDRNNFIEMFSAKSSANKMVSILDTLFCQCNLSSSN